MKWWSDIKQKRAEAKKIDSERIKAFRVLSEEADRLLKMPGLYRTITQSPYLVPKVFIVGKQAPFAVSFSIGEDGMNSKLPPSITALPLETYSMFSEYHYAPVSPEEVGTIVEVTWDGESVGSYTSGGGAYRLS